MRRAVRVCYCSAGATCVPSQLGRGRDGCAWAVSPEEPMATTNLVVDYLVIGIASLVWLAPILLGVWGREWLCSVAKAGPAAAALLLGAGYVLGICVSRLADDVTERWNNKKRDQVFGEGAEPSYHNRVNFIVAMSETASEYLSYRRSIVRVSRACIFHFGGGAVAWVAMALVAPAAVPLVAGLGGGLVCGLLCYLMVKAWGVVLDGYFRSVKDMHEYLIDNGSEEA